MANTEFKEGLEDVVANSSEICFIDGKEGRLVYCGYDVLDLVGRATFEEVVFLLWEGHLPNSLALNVLKQDLASSRNLSPEILQLITSLPKSTDPMDMLRTAVSLAGIYDPDTRRYTPEARRRKAIRLVSQIPTMIAVFERYRLNQDIVAPDPTLSLAQNFLYMLHGSVPSIEQAQIFDTALVLHADHELNASTFAARVTAGTLTDLYSAITAAIGALKGPLHGGANEAVIKMLEEIGTVDNVEPWLREKLTNKVKISGFGHRVYRTEDPRAGVLRRYAEKLDRDCGDTRNTDMLERIKTIIFAEKHLYPNVDLYSGSVYRQLGIAVELYTPVFAMSRIAGWTAHVLEQYRHNRIIRPRAEYVGPTHVDFVAIAERP